MGRRAAAAALVAALLAAGLAILLGGGSGGGGAAGAGKATVATAQVERRTLAERLTLEGTIGYAGASTVVARLAGTVTWLPRVGAVVRRGAPLYGVSGRPVVLMYGRVPAYRRLAEGVGAGPDVRQLEANLVALGYEPGTVDETFTATTAAAVTAWQGDAGLPETGAVPLGRVAFLPGPRRVTKARATLGEAIGGGGGGAMASDGGRASTTTLVAYRSPALGGASEAQPGEPGAATEQPAPVEPGAREPEAGAPQPEAEAPRSDAEAPQPAADAPEREAETAPSVPILEASSTRRVVSVELEPDQQSIAPRGQRVAVVLPDGREARGRVTRLAAIESGGEEGVPGGEDEGGGLEATVVLAGSRRIPALDGAAVSVLFTQRLRRQVLSVPLTALLAIGGDRFAVVAKLGGGWRRIEVTPGIAADGYVEVSGRGLRAGITVEAGE